MAGPFKPLRYRQVHLDFHTSEAIQQIGRDFDADDFVRTLQEAHVDSVTLFARCHHGWCYYPSKVGASHPHLERPDLLGGMVSACRAAGIETPVYITVQWDENLARTRPEWRVASATNQPHNPVATDGSAGFQLTASWHTLCLNNAEYRKYLVDMGREVVALYDPPGLFYDIVGSHECVCPNCVEQMHSAGLDPLNPLDRRKNDETVNEQFRQQISSAIWADTPNVRIFFNSGHVNKGSGQRYATFSHLEIESLPTGPWGYDHFPGSARYAAALGKDYLGQTGKFHTSWGEFGGFKSSQALIYECAQMVSLGAKCMIGDQLHPLGAIDADTYRSIAPAYAHVEKLEPFLKDACQVSEVAILAAECFANSNARSQPSDDGAVRVLLELKIPFDVIDAEMPFDAYKVLILPDAVPTSTDLAEKLNAYARSGGHVIFSGRSGRDPETGAIALDAGIEVSAERIDFSPSYVSVDAPIFSDDVPRSPFVMYGDAAAVKTTTAEVHAWCRAPYFDRSYHRYCSHKHTPVDLDAAPIGPAITTNESFSYIAYPIFDMYLQVGQPIYRRLVQAMLNRVLPDPVLKTTLPTGGRATVTRQNDRLIAHLLFGAPQQRGKRSPETHHPMELIDDIPTLANVTASVRSDAKPTRVFDAVTNEDMIFHRTGNYTTFTLSELHIHAVVVFEFESGEKAS